MLLLDAGAFLAVERNDREIVALIKSELTASRAPKTHGGIVAQVWRGGAGRQARLALLLPGVDVVPLDAELGQSAGMLLKAARAADAIDAALVALASDGDDILTSDVDDLRSLAAAAGVHVELIAV
ncbi:MAG TPA: hypothetical protein VJT73_09440 [Polyangiaceae bacterium]|nr:hypothetical protein [Polyangiaceae bacterium]